MEGLQYYACCFVIFNLDATLKNYKNFLDQMKELPRSRPNPGVLESENLANIILKFNGKTVTLKMNTHDFYIMGFVDNNGTLWEFRGQNEVARLRGSRAAGIGLNYPPLIGLTISKDTIKNAFGELARMREGSDIAYHVAVLCLVFCEGSRFSWASHTFRRCVSSTRNLVIVEAWLNDMIKDWSVLTRLARECEEEDIELTENERMVIKNYKYSFFRLKGPHHRRSQARIARLLVQVPHLPRELYW